MKYQGIQAEGKVAYRGLIIDNVQERSVRQTKWYASHILALKAAAKLLKQTEKPSHIHIQEINN